MTSDSSPHMRKRREDELRKVEEGLESFHQIIGQAPPERQLEHQKLYLELDALRQKVLRTISVVRGREDNKEVKKGSEKALRHLERALEHCMSESSSYQ